MGPRAVFYCVSLAVPKDSLGTVQHSVRCSIKGLNLEQQVYIEAELNTIIETTGVIKRTIQTHI
jgi:hypothetical protein